MGLVLQPKASNLASERRKQVSNVTIPAESFWRGGGNAFEAIVTEYLRRAKKAEQQQTGHDCGHEWTITVESRLHTSGPDEHSDADWTGTSGPVTVRAHNLRDALLLAAAEPFSSWLEGKEAK